MDGQGCRMISLDSECTDVEVSSIASDLDGFDTAYDAIHGLADGLYNIDLRRLPRGPQVKMRPVSC